MVKGLQELQKNSWDASETVYSIERGNNGDEESFRNFGLPKRAY